MLLQDLLTGVGAMIRSLPGRIYSPSCQMTLSRQPPGEWLSPRIMPPSLPEQPTTLDLLVVRICRPSPLTPSKPCSSPVGQLEPLLWLYHSPTSPSVLASVLFLSLPLSSADPKSTPISLLYAIFHVRVSFLGTPAWKTQAFIRNVSSLISNYFWDSILQDNFNLKILKYLLKRIFKTFELKSKFYRAIEQQCRVSTLPGAENIKTNIVLAL